MDTRDSEHRVTGPRLFTRLGAEMRASVLDRDLNQKDDLGASPMFRLSTERV